MSIFSRLFSRFAKTPVPGTLVTVGEENSLYPIAFSNQLVGGYHVYADRESVGMIPVSHLQKDMLITISYHIKDGVIHPRTSYFLKTLPSIDYDRLKDVEGYTFDGYWEIGNTGSKGDKGDQGIAGPAGSNGLTTGIKAYKIAIGGSRIDFLPMGMYSQGNYVDTGNSELKKLKIRGWVSTGNTQYTTMLRLNSSTFASYGGTVISTRYYHVQDRGMPMQWQIEAYIMTTDRYIGFTFARDESFGGTTYGDYGLEVFILD